MKPWMMRTAVILSALALLLTGGWWAWRELLSRDQLQEAILAKDVERVGLLVRFGAPVGADVEFDARWWTSGKPLHWAAGNGHKDTVELLLAHGADVDARSENGRTALHMATISDHRDIVELLLARGADVNAQDNYGMTALHEAVRWGATDSLGLLLVRGADPGLRNNEGDAPVDIYPQLAEIAKKVAAKNAAQESKP
jgi:ankyrin repeat protein